MHLTSRDITIQATLVVKVRVLSAQQITTTFFAGNYSAANRRLRKLVAAGVLIRQRLIARSVLISEPIFNWLPGEPAPHFESLARNINRRWVRQCTRPTTVFMAAERFASQVGRRTRGRLTHPLQISHDLGLAAVYLHLLATSPTLALRWLGEDNFMRSSRRKPTPDALIMNEDAVPVQAIEFGGLYDAKRYQRFHSYCFNRELPYAIY